MKLLFHLLTKFIAVLFLLLQTDLIHAQDAIQTFDGKIIQAKIIAVTTENIVYKISADSSTHSIARTDVQAFKYGTSKKDPTDYFPERNEVPSAMYMKGVHDAEMYYKGYRAAASGTFWSTVLVGPGPGLIPAFFTSSNAPRKQNLNYPDSLLMQNGDYYHGYTEQAKAKKGKKVWRSYTAGALMNAVFVIVLIAGSL